MSLLKREGMHPLSFGFAEEYAAETKKADRLGELPIRDGITEEQFHNALSSIGVTGPKSLAGLLGCTVESAQIYYHNPLKINTARNAPQYLSTLNEALWNTWAYQDLKDAESLDEAERAKRNYDDVFERDGYNFAVSEEFGCRALLEGFLFLDPIRKRQLLEQLRLLLQDAGEEHSRTDYLVDHGRTFLSQPSAAPIGALLRACTVAGPGSFPYDRALYDLIRDERSTSELAEHEGDYRVLRATLDEYAGLS